MIGLLPPRNEVHLWYLQPQRAGDAAAWDRCVTLLSPEERGRWERYRHASARALFLAGAVLVRTTLSQYLDVPCDQWQFAANAYGKPRIVAPLAGLSLCFNLTHTEGLAACAVAWERAVGVDAERVGRTVDRDLARRFFAPAEVAHLDCLPEAQRGDVFLRYWTAKEAYLKALGTGLSTALDSFTIDLAADRPRLTGANDTAAVGWEFFQLQPTPEHWVAVAVSARREAPVTLVIREAAGPPQGVR